MKYKNITLKKYQIIKHIINKYAEAHDNVTPNINYTIKDKILDISGISKPINFNTTSIGIIPEGAYEVVGQVIRSKTDDGHIDKDGMKVYNSGQRIFNIANDNRDKVFDFITENSRSSYCACCGTSRERSKLFYIRRVDTPDNMYQVGSSCIKEHFDTSYFDLMRDISNVIESEGRLSNSQFSDYNLIDYLTLYCMFTQSESSIAARCKKVTDILDSDDISKTSCYNEFLLQKVTTNNKISDIAKFYTSYPNYIREDNVFAIKTVQSMAEMLDDNIDIDPYYSKTNCANIAKLYISLLQDYDRDYRNYQADLFKYNAYLVETELTNLWKEHNNTVYYLSFELDRRASNISYKVCIPNECFKVAASSEFIGIKIVVPLNKEGNMLDENDAKLKLLSLVSRVNTVNIAPSSWKLGTIKKTLEDYKAQCLSRYPHFKPTITCAHDKTRIRYFDYSNEPLIIDINDDTEQAKMKLSAFINLAYNRKDLSAAYKKFIKKYTGNMHIAYKQSKQLNLQFSCDYAENQFKSNWPKDYTLSRVISHIDTAGDNIIINYNTSPSSFKLPVNSLGVISGSDYDITVRIKTFIAKELGLPVSFYKDIRPPKSAEDKLKNRPKKNVTRLFSSLGVSASNLVSVNKVNILNDASSNTLGVSTKGLGKILFSIDNGNPICENDIYRGRISLDGHLISDSKTFDKKTFINAVHALEYLVYLSDESNNLICNLEITQAKRGMNYTYKHSLSFGNCTGNLQFRIAQSDDKFTLKYGPKFIIEKTLSTDKVVCAINLNFNEQCWSDIKQGILNLGDIQRGSGVVNGQRNNNLISGTVWVNSGEPQRITNEMFTKLTGITI